MVPKQKNKMEKGSQRRNGNCSYGQQETFEKQPSRQTRGSAFLLNDQSAKLYDSTVSSVYRFRQVQTKNTSESLIFFFGFHSFSEKNAQRDEKLKIRKRKRDENVEGH